MNGTQRERLIAAADQLDCLYEGSEHIPTDLFHDRDFRVGLVRPECTRVSDMADLHAVAHFFYGGAAEVFLTMGPAVLPLLSPLLRQVADSPTDGALTAALALADHILEQKE